MIACTPTCRPQLLPQVDDPRVRPGHFVTGYPIYSWTNHVVLFFLRGLSTLFRDWFFLESRFSILVCEGRESGLSRVSDRQSVAFVHPCVDRRVDCWVAVAVLEGKLSFLPLKRVEYIYSGSTMSGQQGMRMALLGVQKLRVDARIGLLHRSKNNINSSSSIEKLETALLEIWKWPGAVSEKAKERERDKDGGQVKTVSLPGWKKVLAGNGTKWSWSIIKVALIRSKTFFI